MASGSEYKRKRVNRGRKETKSKNAYLISLINLYERIEKQTTNETVQKILARLKMSRTNRAPLRVTEVVEFNSATPDNICVFVGKVLDNETVFEIPKIRIVALAVSKAARAKIEKFGGSIYTFDQLFEVSPSLSDVTLVKGDASKRKSCKFFGAPGDKGSKTYPRIGNNKGRNAEKRLLRRGY